MDGRKTGTLAIPPWGGVRRPAPKQGRFPDMSPAPFAVEWRVTRDASAGSRPLFIGVDDPMPWADATRLEDGFAFEARRGGASPAKREVQRRAGERRAERFEGS